MELKPFSSASIVAFTLFTFLLSSKCQTMQRVELMSPRKLQTSIHATGINNTSDDRVLNRLKRQNEASYEEGVEYEYEDEEEVTNSTSQPFKENDDNDRATVVPPKESDDNHQVDGEDEYYETYDDNEDERERERDREEEEARKEEERREEERKEEERREEEERLDEERREKERKEEAAREEEEERLEEEKRQQEERNMVEEQLRLAERRKEEERRQQEEYEASLEEEEVYSSPQTPYLVVTTPETHAAEDNEVESKSETETIPVDERTNEIDEDVHHEEITPPETIPEREEKDGIQQSTPEPIPIEESGRHDLERYSSGREEESSGSFEYVEEDEDPTIQPEADEITTSTVPPKYEDERLNEIVEEEVEESQPDEPEETHRSYPVSTQQPLQVEVSESEGAEVEPSRPPHQRPFEPYQPPVVEEETRDPDEYEVEPPPSSENEIEPEIHSTPKTPEVTTPPHFEHNLKPGFVDGRILGERERYHHQDLGLDEEEEEETELYEGRRFNEESRRDQIGSKVSPPSFPTHPPAPIDESSITDLSREPEDPEENEIDDTNNEKKNVFPSTEKPMIPTIDEDESSSVEIDAVPNSNLPSSKNEESQSSSSSSSSESEQEKVTEAKKPWNPAEFISPTQPIHLDSITGRPEMAVNGLEEESPKSHIECFPGYKISDDGTECLDLNECNEAVCGPTQICSNIPGSYRCSCHPGFIKDFRNEKVCRDLNECEIGNGGCSQDCVNIQGSFYCSCSDEFYLAPNKRTCIRKAPILSSTTTTTTTTSTTTTTPPPTTTISTTTPKPYYPPTPPNKQKFPGVTPQQPILVGNEESPIKNCPTPPVPKGAGIAYLYCSRSPVGIHHRHSQMEQRLIQDWTARKSKGHGHQNNFNMVRHPRNLRQQSRNRRNLRRRQRQTTYSPGSMCELRCRSGFELRGHYTLNCNASTGAWQGTTNGFCQALPKVDNQNLGILTHSEATPSNEIPRLANGISAYHPNSFDYQPTKSPFRQTVDSPQKVTSFRPIFQLPSPAERRPITPPPPASRFSDLDATNYWSKQKYSTPTTVTAATTTTRRPYYNYYSPATYRPFPITTPTPSLFTTTSRNSFIQLSYRFKTPWIKCPDDIRIDLPPNQNLAYVIIPQPQTNVDWWRQVTAEPSWAKGLETEIGPGKQRITFRARTSAPVNNTAECAFTLEIRDMDPPRVRECPESFTIRLNPGQSAKAVTWLEPHFSDNVRITSLKKSHDPGTIMALGEHLINYEARDPNDNVARCSFTVTVLPPHSPYSNGNNGYTHYRKPLNEGVTSSTTPTTFGRPEVHSAMKNVVCYVGKKGRRIVFVSRVVPRGCSEISMDVAGDTSIPGSYNTLNTVSQNSAENLATSQISSVSYSSHDTPQSASAFSQALSNGRNTNRMVHSTSSVTNGAHGTNSKSSSYAISVSSSSRNFEVPFITDKQVYDEDPREQDFVIPTAASMKRSGLWVSSSDVLEKQSNTKSPRQGERNRRVRLGGSEIRDGGQRISNNQNSRPENKKYFRNFDSWGTNGPLVGGT